VGRRAPSAPRDVIADIHRAGGADDFQGIAEPDPDVSPEVLRRVAALGPWGAMIVSWHPNAPAGRLRHRDARGLGYAAAVLGAGGPVRDWVMRRFAHDDDESSDDGKAGRLADRWGVPGLAGIGSVVLGPTITLLAALTLGVDLKKFGLWYGAATIVIFAVLTLFWDLVLSVD
jgi:hypothetical protein